MHVAVLDDYQDVARSFADWELLPAPASLRVFSEHIDDPDTLVERLSPFDVVCTMRERTPLPAAIIERLPNLRLIVTSGPRNASIDVEAATAAGVVVCGTSSLGYPTAELAWALILALALRLPDQLSSLRGNRWQGPVGGRLQGKTLGILGLGRIGGLVARYAQTFEMDVLAWSRNLTQDQAAAKGAGHVPFDELLASSDFVTIHLQLSERTQGLVDADAIGRMKPSACLVNTARSPIVDTRALISALDAGTIGGAAVDVFDREPLPADDPLLSCKNLLLTPHIGYVARENYEIFYREMLEAILAFASGKPIRVIEP